jgi:hypothetical protein
MKVISTIHLAGDVAEGLLEFDAHSRSIRVASGEVIALWPNGLTIRDLIDDVALYGGVTLFNDEGTQPEIPQSENLRLVHAVSEVFPTGLVTASHKFGQSGEISDIDKFVVTYAHQVNLDPGLASNDITIVPRSDIMLDSVVIGSVNTVVVPTGVEAKLGTFDYRALGLGHALEVFGDAINET